MTTILQTINLGQYPNDGTGDDLRTAFTKVNANFNTLKLALGVTGGTNLGAGTSVFADVNGSNLEFRTLISSDNSVDITSTSNVVDLKTITTLFNDPNPSLGAALGLNGNVIHGPGDVQSTVYGYDISIISSLLQIAMQSNTLVIDLCPAADMSAVGEATNFHGYPLDMGLFTDNPLSNQIDFGTIV
jgi:hypothetical protein